VRERIDLLVRVSPHSERSGDHQAPLVLDLAFCVLLKKSIRNDAGNAHAEAQYHEASQQASTQRGRDCKVIDNLTHSLLSRS
jgi:hypothetical protein